jgi:hypothetical protein
MLFFSGNEAFALSLLWPIKEINPGDLITRNYLPNVPLEDPTRALRLLAFHRESGVVGRGEGGEVGQGVGEGDGEGGKGKGKGKGGGASNTTSINATVSKNGDSNSVNVSNEF